MNTSTLPTVEVMNCRLRLGNTGTESVIFQLNELCIQPGDQIALTGPSGCGKSTLLNLIAGLRRPDQGTISVQGQSLADLSPSKLDTFRGRTMGFIFQNFNLLDRFSALENVLIGLRFGRSRNHFNHHDRAMTLLDRVGLQRRLHSRPDKLSVGERQRVAIARAIANRPSLLLADEPTGSLDPSTAAKIFELIREVCVEEKCALLLVTHDLHLAGQLPRKMDCQNLVQHIPADEVKT
jgi:ABC-type lipoprotein export system ATPase subunit